MTKDEIEKAVDNFLVGQDRTFSQIWRDALVERAAALPVEMPDQFIDKIHEEKLLELWRGGARWLRHRSSDYKPEQVEDIVSTGFLKWLKYFDARKSLVSKNPELNYLIVCVTSARSDQFNTDHPVVNEELMLDEAGNPLLDDTGGTKKQRRTRATNISDTDADAEIGRLAARLPVEDSRTIDIGGKDFALEAAAEVYKYYLLCGRVKPPAFGRQNALPEVEVTHKPIRRSVTDSAKPELSNVAPATVYGIRRLHVLKSAEARRWMELAVSEMRKSKGEMLSHLERKKKLNPSITQQSLDDFKSKRPILSAVALDRGGELIATCYKGQVGEPGDEDRAWNKHCEFSLFNDVIKEKNMPLLKGGSLFVTLEPCNKRGFYLDCNVGKPKIPCAVRCVEAQVDTVYIGSLDFNQKVYEKGKAILETGSYVFELDGGAVTDEASKLLERYFISKGYAFNDSSNTRTYRIGKTVKVRRFDEDLIEEVCELNAWFLRAHKKEFFR
jgi:pyrimidine deaminase RibD-like protein